MLVPVLHPVNVTVNNTQSLPEEKVESSAKLSSMLGISNNELTH